MLVLKLSMYTVCIYLTCSLQQQGMDTGVCVCLCFVCVWCTKPCALWLVSMCPFFMLDIFVWYGVSFYVGLSCRYQTYTGARVPAASCQYHPLVRLIFSHVFLHRPNQGQWESQLFYCVHTLYNM